MSTLNHKPKEEDEDLKARLIVAIAQRERQYKTIDRLKAAAEADSNQIAALKQELEEVIKDRDTLKASVERVGKQRDRIKRSWDEWCVSVCESLGIDEDDYPGTIKAAGIIGTIAEDVQTKNIVIKEYQESCDIKDNQIAALNLELEKRTTERDKYKALNAGCSLELEQARAIIQADNESYDQDIAELKHARSYSGEGVEPSEYIEGLVSNIGDLKQELEQARKERDDYKAQAFELQSRITKLQAKVEQYKALLPELDFEAYEYDLRVPLKSDVVYDLSGIGWFSASHDWGAGFRIVRTPKPSKYLRPEEITDEMIELAKVDDPFHFAANLNAMLTHGYCSRCKMVPAGCEREGCRAEVERLKEEAVK